MEHPEIITVKTDYSIELSKRSIQQSGTRYSQPIRILPDYSNLRDSRSCTSRTTVNIPDTTPAGYDFACTDADILSPAKEAGLKAIIDKAILFWNSTISVEPLGALQLASTCSSTTVPSSYSNLPNYDFVLMVTARPIKSNATIATAATCQSASNTNRPVCGHANFAPSKLEDVATELHSAENLAVVIHEMAHALGFSSSSYGRYIKYANDTSTTPIPIAESEVQQTNNGLDYLVTPNVVAAAKAHFGCTSSNWVAPLEANGGSGTAGSHWALKQFFNDFMVGITTSFPLYSQMTFALLEDTGWYKVHNRSRLESLVWGRGLGCSFITDCGSWPEHSKTNPGYRCTVADPNSQTYILDSEEQCTADLRGEGNCYDGNPLMATATGKCTYIATSTEKRCDNPFNTFGIPIANVNPNVGSKTSSASRCFYSSLLKLNDQLEGPGSIKSFSQCYSTTCAGPTKLKVGIENIWYDCPYAGGDIEPIGFGGALACIPKAADRICLDAVVDNDWPNISSVSPTSGPPGAFLTIKGFNFKKTANLTVRVQSTCSNLTVVSDTLLTCTVGPSSDFSTFRVLAYSLLGSIPVPVVVRDAKDRTAAMKAGWSVELSTKDAFMNFLTVYPGWFALSCVVFVALIVLAFMLLKKCCCK